MAEARQRAHRLPQSHIFPFNATRRSNENMCYRQKIATKQRPRTAVMVQWKQESDIQCHLFSSPCHRNHAEIENSEWPTKRKDVLLYTVVIADNVLKTTEQDLIRATLGWGEGETPPSTYFSMAKKWKRILPPNHAYLFFDQFCTSWPKEFFGAR